MKKFGTKMMAGVLAAALLLQGSAAAATSLGKELHTSAIDVTQNTTLSESAFWHTASGRQQEYYFESKPSAAAMPVVAYGNKLYGTSNIDQIGDYLKNKGYKVVAGINADFFSFQTGLPLGMVVTDGVLRCSDAGEPAIGFDAQGNAFIGTPGLSMTARVTVPAETAAPESGTEQELPADAAEAGGEEENPAEETEPADGGESAETAEPTVETVTIDHVNKLRTPYALYMLTSDFSTSSRNTTDGYDVILRIREGSLAIGGTVKAVVESKTRYAGAIAIEDDMLVITCDAKGPVERLAAFEPGREVEITVSAEDERFCSAQNAVGGSEILVSDGVIKSGLSSEKAPRSAVGIKADGTLVMYVNDGRQSGYSTGMSLGDVAARMIELGCVQVLNFDGGGSTAISTDYPGTGNLTVINSPSEGSLRKCANYLFLVNTTEPTGTAEKLFLYPYDVMALPGAAVSFTPRATDANYHEADVPEELTYAVSDPALGAVTGSGTFVAGSSGMTGRVWVSSGTAQGYATVQVVDRPDEMAVTINGKSVSSLAAAPGSSYTITAKAYYKTYELQGGSRQFTYEVTGGIGTVTEDGVFTAARQPGASGSLRITVGQLTTEIPVTVGKSPVIAEGFESSDYAAVSQPAGVTLAEQSNRDFVRYGKRSALMRFENIPAAETAEDGTVTAGQLMAAAEIALADSPSYVNLYVYGDGSGADLQVIAATGSGESAVDIGMIDFCGWRQISVALPAGTTAIRGFSAVNHTDAPLSMTVYIDQIQAAYSSFADSVPPVVTIEPVVQIIGAETIAVIGTATDDGTVLTKEDIRLTLDGAPQEFDYDQNTGTIVAAVKAPGDVKLHRISVQATDASGNIGKASTDIGGQSQVFSFVDTAKHWAAGYADFLYDNGILGGEMIGSLRYFYPDKEMSRAELAKIMSNFGGYDTARYENVSLPYTDVGDIPDWALPYVKVMLAEGIIKGKDIGGGQLAFDPNGAVTRAEMMTIIGRMQVRGYARAELNFTDADSIPSYARSYVETLVAQGVISGYDDGSLRPNSPVRRGEMAKMFFTLY